MTLSQDDKLIFSDDPTDPSSASEERWKILIVDDEQDIHEVTRLALADLVFEGKSIEFLSAFSGQEARKILQEHHDIAIAFLDVVMEDDHAGLHLVKYIRDELCNPIIRILIRTGQAGYAPEKQIILEYDIDDYKEKSELTATKLFTTIVASLRSYRLLSAIETSKAELQSENRSIKKRLGSSILQRPDAFRSILTVNSEMKANFQYIEVIAGSKRPVLITGDTGVGKELFAKVIHKVSGRSGELITVNVAGLDDNLFSDTLFGHEKGAYSGADKVRKGLIAKAANGTLFLDEIGDLQPQSQVKLLRLLQEQEYYPLGSDERKIAKARIVAATHCDLENRMKAGDFREDLYYRLSTHEIPIPSLRNRKDDLPLLLQHFVTKAATELNRPVPSVPREVLTLCKNYNFPGNIRELEAVTFDAVSRTRGGELALEVFQKKFAISLDQCRPATVFSFDNKFEIQSSLDGEFPTLKEMDDMLIAEALRRTENSQQAAAELLGISRQALNQRLKKKAQS